MLDATIDIDKILESKSESEVFDLMVAASVKRNALIGALEVARKKQWIPDSSFTTEIQARIQAEEQMIFSCYDKLTKDDESES